MFNIVGSLMVIILINALLEFWSYLCIFYESAMTPWCIHYFLKEELN